MSPTTGTLGIDHLNLLVTAACQWRVLTSRTAAAFSRAEAHLVVASATEAGRMLQQENLSAIRWHADRGRGRLADRLVPDPYTYTEVDRIDPVEVIKACHSAEAACEASPGWSASTAKRLLVAIVTAATYRIDGYADAPWHWTRPSRRSGPPIAVGGDWRPELPGVTWISPADAGEHWQEASLVIVTSDVAAQLPTLPPRAGVFILAAHEPVDEVWQAIVALDDHAVVMFWPSCEPWLREQLNDPAPEFVEHRAPSS